MSTAVSFLDLETIPRPALDQLAEEMAGPVAVELQKQPVLDRMLICRSLAKLFLDQASSYRLLLANREKIRLELDAFASDLMDVLGTRLTAHQCKEVLSLTDLPALSKLLARFQQFEARARKALIGNSQEPEA